MTRLGPLLGSLSSPRSCESAIFSPRVSSWEYTNTRRSVPDSVCTAGGADGAASDETATVAVGTAAFLPRPSCPDWWRLQAATQRAIAENVHSHWHFSRMDSNIRT